MKHPFIDFLQKKYYIDDPDNAFEMFCESNCNQILAIIEDYKQSSVDSLVSLHIDQMEAQQQEIDRLTKVIMNHYILSEKDLEEILKKQRELCAENFRDNGNPDHSIPYTNDLNLCLAAIEQASSPPLPETTGVIDWEGLEIDFFRTCMVRCEKKDGKAFYELNQTFFKWLKTNLHNYIKP